ncbi:uncharacterized protein LOC126726743 [Quercus robur]|uniref:uncharacterized protein LOC126726743 n=1 Tax=Quercus robur TaxID=38942 RepID=UPI002163B904|nr:uncharacterized protein LOC126726743 [Quercus robur]
MPLSSSFFVLLRNPNHCHMLHLSHPPPTSSPPRITDSTTHLFKAPTFFQWVLSNPSSSEINDYDLERSLRRCLTTIYEHWWQKRERKGMPLIRHLQPPLWERYQQQVKEWVLALNKNNANIPNGFQEKAAPIEKPPTFAFCLKQ